MSIDRTVLITGAGGYIGRLLVQRLAADRAGLDTIVATDIRNPPDADRHSGVEYETLDVRDPSLVEILRTYSVDTVVHLAAIVTPGRDSDHDLEYSVDVVGTKNVLQCCHNAGVKHFVYTSSGAAYGYHADNADSLEEDAPLRGNDSFAYSRHKRLIEEMLSNWREEHPELGQLIFRPGTILGSTAKNQITNLFEKPLVLGLRGSESPFVIIWDEDVVSAIEFGLRGCKEGLYNLAGDGVLTLREMATIMEKPYIELPTELVMRALSLMKKLNMTRYGPEQVDFLRYRPVLNNTKLKEELLFIPEKTTREVFEHYLAHRR